MAIEPQNGRSFSPPSAGWRHTRWAGGEFDSAHRTFSAEVEGEICISNHLLLVTLAGGARRVEVRLDDGHRHSGPDYAGLVSFLPAGCRRSLTMLGVESEWASLSLDSRLFEGNAWPPFTNVPEPFLVALISELAHLQRVDGTIESGVLDAAALLAARRLSARARVGPSPEHVTALSPRRLRLIKEHVDHHLAEEIRIADLARLAQLSPGYFHRCFVKSTGETPLAFVTRRRIETAAERLAPAAESVAESVAQVALSVGFSSPSHFARCFRRIMGTPPSVFARK